MNLISGHLPMLPGTLTMNTKSSAASAQPTQAFEQPLNCFVSKRHLKDPAQRVSSTSAVQLHAYANRSRVTDHSGMVHDFTPMTKRDFVSSEMYFPVNVPTAPALRVWQAADQAAERTGRATEIISNHMICRLPAASPEIWRAMITCFVEEYLTAMGLIVEATLHNPCNKSPHVHFQISRRRWSADGAFEGAIFHATSAETRARWRRGWINGLAAHAQQS